MRRRRADLEVKKVYCCGCRRVTRDTEGRCFSAVTGEYFMGTCAKGHGDGLPGRVFMDKARECDDYIGEEES